MTHGLIKEMKELLYEVTKQGEDGAPWARER